MTQKPKHFFSNKSHCHCNMLIGCFNPPPNPNIYLLNVLCFRYFILSSHSLNGPSLMSSSNAAKSHIFRKPSAGPMTEGSIAVVRWRRGMLGNVCAELGSQFLHWTTLANMQMARHVVMQKCPASTLCTLSPVLAWSPSGHSTLDCR